MSRHGYEPPPQEYPMETDDVCRECGRSRPRALATIRYHDRDGRWKHILMLGTKLVFRNNLGHQPLLGLGNVPVGFSPVSAPEILVVGTHDWCRCPSYHRQLTGAVVEPPRVDFLFDEQDPVQNAQPIQAEEIIGEPVTRAEHLQWCKDRARQEYEYSKERDPSKARANAVASMVSDLNKHPDTKALLPTAAIVMLTVTDERSLMAFIDGF